MGIMKGVLKAVVPLDLTRKVTTSGMSVSLSPPRRGLLFLYLHSLLRLLARLILNAALCSCVKTALQQIPVSMATLPFGMDRLT